MSALPGGVEPLERAAESDAVRATFRSLGVDIPQLLVVLSGEKRRLIGFRTHSDDATATWELIRAHTEGTRFYPLVIRDEHEVLNAWPDDLDSGASSLLAAAETVDAETWLEARREEMRQDGAVIPRRRWASCPPNNGFMAPFDTLTGKPAPNVFILLLPATAGSDMPAFLNFGGWNDCPDPAVQIAMLRRWREAHGAEPVTCAGDILELRVEDPHVRVARR